MQPLFILKVRKPGSSFAFEIAKKIGFPSFVLQKAKKKSGGKHVRFDQQLQQLETDKMELDKKHRQIESADETLSNIIEKYTNLLNELTKTKKQIIQDAKQKASEIITDSNKAIEKTIREIKEAQANKEKTKEARKELEKKKKELESKEEKAKAEAKEREEETTGEIKEGDFVSVKETDIIGEVILIDGDKALINVNDVKLRISFDKLEKSSKPPKKIMRSSLAGIISDINKKATQFELSIDLRGKRSEEAIYLLQKYIDEAILLSMKEVNILHGKGYGILRENIREYLQSIDEIKHFEDAPLSLGGAGITRVYLK